MITLDNKEENKNHPLYDIFVNNWKVIVGGFLGSLATIFIGQIINDQLQIEIPQYFDLLTIVTFILLGANAGFNMGKAFDSTKRDAHIFLFVYHFSIFGFFGIQYLLQSAYNPIFYASLFVMLTILLIVDTDIYKKENIPYLKKLIDFASDYASYFTFFVYIASVYIIIPMSNSGINVLTIVISVALIAWIVGILTYKKGNLDKEFDWTLTFVIILLIVGLIVGWLLRGNIPIWINEINTL